jgi:hypothetical protein
LLTTVISFDSAQPIDPSVDPPPDSDDENSDAVARTAEERSSDGLPEVFEDEEDDDVGPLLDSVLAAAAASESSHAPWSLAVQAQRRPAGELERVPGPSAALNSKKFAFAKAVTVTTTRVVAPAPTVVAARAAEPAQAGSWAGLLPTTATAQVHQALRKVAGARGTHQHIITSAGGGWITNQEAKENFAFAAFDERRFFFASFVAVQEPPPFSACLT